MKFTAQVTIMPLSELLDPQGKAVNSSLQNLGLSDIEDVRIGKHVTLQVNAPHQQAAEAMVEEACKKLLHNPVMEHYHFTVHPAS